MKKRTKTDGTSMDGSIPPGVDRYPASGMHLCAESTHRKFPGLLRIRERCVPLATAGFIAGVGLWSYMAIEESLKRELANELTTILQADVTALQLWIDEQEHTVGIRANETRVRKLVGELVRLAAQQTTTPDVLLHSTPLRELREYLEPMCRAHGYIGFVVMDRQGVNVAALLDEPVGLRSLADRSDFVERALAGETLVCRPFPGEVLLPDERGVFRAGRPTMFSAAPVRDVGERIIAALSFRIRPEVDFTRILSVARTGVTGETFAFDGDGLLMSTSRFDAQAQRHRPASRLCRDPIQSPDPASRPRRQHARGFPAITRERTATDENGRRSYRRA